MTVGELIGRLQLADVDDRTLVMVQVPGVGPVALTGLVVDHHDDADGSYTVWLTGDPA